MLNVAHRGFSGRFPENTLLAFEEAIRAGCDGIELDVHQTKDGALVICHDETIDRTTNGSGRIADRTLEELRQYDAHGAFPGQYPPQRIPTLEEYFALVQPSPIFTNIEIKTDNYYYPDIEQQIVEAVYTNHMEHRVLFSSFNHATILRCKELAPRIPCGFLCGKPIGNAGCYVRSFGAEYLHPNFDELSEADLKSCAEHLVGINVWLLNDSDTPLEELLRYPFISVITNWPDRVHELLEKQRASV